jgi:hypothetical protein
MTKWKNDDLQNTTQKTKDWPTRIPLKTEYTRRCSWRISSSCSHKELKSDLLAYFGENLVNVLFCVFF